MVKFIINIEKTAITNGVSISVKKYNTIFDKNIIVLDYGCGKLRNSKFLLKEGFKNIYIFDTKRQIDNLSNEEKSHFKGIFTNAEDINIKFDLILCNYVLNVIPDFDTREYILSEIYRLLNTNGKAIIEVRKENNIIKGKYVKKYKDGYLMGKGFSKTFQKPYSKDEFMELLLKHDFKIEELCGSSDGYYALVSKKNI